MQCDVLMQWLECFAPQARLCALAVYEGERMVAALPLVGTKLRGLVTVGRIPGNEWSSAGELMVDPQASVERVLEVLVQGLGDLHWPLLWFDTIDAGSWQWRALRKTLKRAGLRHVSRTRYHVGRVEIDHDWKGYEASWSRNHRRHVRRSLTRAESEGQLELEVFGRLEPSEIEPLLRLGFEVEDRSWKGQEQSSVLKSPDAFDFFLEQARLLAVRHQLELVFLKHNGQPIAFEYGWFAKNTYFSPKVGYDEAFHRFAPGQLLRYKLFEKFFAEPDRKCIDFLGAISDATAKWSTSTYPIDWLMVATRRRRGRILLKAYQSLSGMRRWLRGKRSQSAESPGVLPIPRFADRAAPVEPGGVL